MCVCFYSTSILGLSMDILMVNCTTDSQRWIVLLSNKLILCFLLRVTFFSISSNISSSMFCHKKSFCITSPTLATIYNQNIFLPNKVEIYQTFVDVTFQHGKNIIQTFSCLHLAFNNSSTRCEDHPKNYNGL